jgi:hypothetical protein
LDIWQSEHGRHKPIAATGPDQVAPAQSARFCSRESHPNVSARASAVAVAIDAARSCKPYPWGKTEPELFAQPPGCRDVLRRRGIAMPDPLRTEIHTSSIEEDESAVSWATIAAGGITAAALTLVLLAFGPAWGSRPFRPGPIRVCRAERSKLGPAFT